MSLATGLAEIFRSESRRALGREITADTIGQDLMVYLASLPLHEARVFVSRLDDACLAYLVNTAPPEPPAPEPAAPAAAAPDPDEATVYEDEILISPDEDEPNPEADNPPADEPSTETA